MKKFSIVLAALVACAVTSAASAQDRPMMDRGMHHGMMHRGMMHDRMHYGMMHRHHHHMMHRMHREGM